MFSKGFRTEKRASGGDVSVETRSIHHATRSQRFLIYKSRVFALFAAGGFGASAFSPDALWARRKIAALVFCLIVWQTVCDVFPNRAFRPRPIGRRLVPQTLSSPKAFFLRTPRPQAIPAHTTRFRHLSLKSRWPPSSRSSSPPGACRSAIPHHRARAAARRARRSHDRASVQFVTDARTRPTRPRARRARAPRDLPALPRRRTLASIVDPSTPRPPRTRASRMIRD